MFRHASNIAYTKQESIEFQQLQLSHVNSNSNCDNIIYGVEIPNRVFVGGVAYDTTELELKNFFQSFGEIKDAKIVTDRDGSSKGYGFITFEREEQAMKMQGKKTIYFKEKKLNIGPAIRKQGGQFPKANQEFLTGQIKVFINSSHSPVYTPSGNEKISPMVYSISPSHYVPTMPYCHHTDSPRFSTTSRQQIIPLAPNEPTHFVYPFPPSMSTHPPSQALASHFDQVKMFSPDSTPAHTPSPLHSLPPFHFPSYPIILPPERFFSPHEHSESSTTTWYKMSDSKAGYPLHSLPQDLSKIRNINSYNEVNQKSYSEPFLEDRRLSTKQQLSQLEPSFKKMSLKKTEVDPTGQLTPPPSPESV